jgi:glutamyl-tRNA(Gln) amidotransferase subunit E
MAQHAKTRGVQGIFHSDELPAYGITENDVKAIRVVLCLEEGKAFALCADDADKAEAAIRIAVERANQAIHGVPEETRDPMPDGSTVYSRPLPGASRMYPETDVKPIPIHPDRLNDIQSKLPEMPEQKVRRFVERYGVHEQQAHQIVRNGYEEVFEEVSSRFDLAAVAARTLLNTLPELEKEGVDVAKLSEYRLREAFQELHQGAFVKEAMPSVLRKMAEGANVQDAIKSLGLQRVDTDEARSIIAAIVKEKETLVKEKGMAAQGPLMGLVMEHLRGKIDGKTASELLKKEISKLLTPK